MKYSSILLALFITSKVFAQSDSATVRVQKDPRIDLLIKKQVQINEETTRETRSHIPGFRIQVINSNDRNKVFALKAKIYQQYPELKPYLMYQAPNYRLKVGNFRSAEEAEPYRKQLSALVPTGVYTIRDVIDVNPDADSSTDQ